MFHEKPEHIAPVWKCDDLPTADQAGLWEALIFVSRSLLLKVWSKHQGPHVGSVFPIHDGHAQNAHLALRNVLEQSDRAMSFPFHLMLKIISIFKQFFFST